MIFTPIPLAGAYVLTMEPIADDRGFFSRVFCTREFTEHGLNPAVAQASMSYSRKRGTLRGLHYQKPPHEEVKLVRCTRGAVWDVMVDIRPDSPTRAQWFGATLSVENRTMVYVPEGFAHGFITLEDDSEIFYQMSVPYSPGTSAELRWNDPAFGIEWPLEPVVISDKDRLAGDFVL